MNKYIEYITVVVLGSTGLTAVLIWVFKKIISTGIEETIKNRYDTKIENLRNDLMHSQSMFTSSLLAQTEGIKISYAKRLEAVDKYWASILRIKKNAEPLSTVDPFIPITRFEKIHTLENNMPEAAMKTFNYSLGQIDFDKILNDGAKDTTELELLRPYIGEELWLLRYYFNLFISRILLNYSRDFIEKKPMNHWLKDEYLRERMNEILSKDEQAFLYQSTVDGVNRGINIFIERILSEITKITTGESAGKSSLNTAIILSKMFSDKSNAI